MTAMSDRLKVGIVGPLPPPSGGMANQTQQLANLLKGENIQVEVIQTNSRYKPEWVRNIPVVRALFRLLYYVVELWRAANRVDVFHIMANSGWSWHLFTVPAIWIAKIRKTPTVINYRGGEADKFFSRSFKYVKPTLNASDKVVVPSCFLEEVFKKYGITTTIIANIIDLDRFVANKNQKVKPAPRLLVARNLETIYGNDVAIRAFAEVVKVYPDARLTIAGSGPELKNLECLSEKLAVNEKITFTGRVDTTLMPTLYQSADVVLNPSRVDNMPNSILESLASGTPVVTTNVGGIPYIVKHEKTALLVDPDDYIAMAAAICKLLKNSQFREEMIDKGRDSVRQYSWSEVGQHWISLYKKLTV